MKLLYVFNKVDFPSGSKIFLPIGIKKIKIRGNAGACSIKELGYISASPINSLPSMEFPIINGKSPNSFTIANWTNEAIDVNILVEELGGIPDPNYFLDTPTVIPEIISDDPTEQEEK